jgi:hypothetical protein
MEAAIRFAAALNEEDYVTSGDRVIETTRLLLRLPEAADARLPIEFLHSPIARHRSRDWRTSL